VIDYGAFVLATVLVLGALLVYAGIAVLYDPIPSGVDPYVKRVGCVPCTRGHA
jgi:hypothetical protein